MNVDRKQVFGFITLTLIFLVPIFIKNYDFVLLHGDKAHYFQVHALLGRVYDTFTDGSKNISQNDIYVSVKTCKRFHNTRVALILKTWWNLMKDQAFFYTDTEDAELRTKTRDHLVVTKCGRTHNKFHLCCKLWEEFLGYYKSDKKWWCHMDDDNYVNPRVLVKVLNEYDWREPMYLGRLSLKRVQTHMYKGKKEKYRFATGGAGVCITRIMSRLMMPHMRNGSFEDVCRELNQADDVALGFIVTNLLKKNLTIRNDFNSHLQRLKYLPSDKLLSQAVLSYHDHNFVKLTSNMSVFPLKEDMSRMLSIHCLLYPQTDWCP